MKRNIGWAAALAAGILVLVLAGGSYLSTTQNFPPNRYALLAATVDTASLQQAGQTGNPHRALFKMDNATGKVWVLQLTVAGPGNPSVVAASWSPVNDAKSGGTP